ncbi:MULTISPECIES: tRNA 2-selenouridine(34) synthase MnmH [unclassified Saccharicrinis]|uniref:tRNA 2-selenouridine(34) synthase MnmH n=1 Tax=unclassified Saccharicrinis TaxID=2646859 RepID=UPI003D34EC75
MTEILIEEYFNIYNSYPIIDVRSPGEFSKGHIVGAHNIPLFTNAERAHVGTVYKQQGQEIAMDLGLEYVTPKLSWFVEESAKWAPNKKVVVHCWRGGMRSHAFADHLEENGFEDVRVIQKGYKAYRNFVLDSFKKEVDLKIIGGYTGSGKTHILTRLNELGCQVIDLEALACHKGSAFGAIGENSQPTVEQFENNLFDLWRKLDFNQPVYLEDESHNIGRVKLPMDLFVKIRNAKVYFLDIPKEKRALALVKEYAGIDDELLEHGILTIAKRLGGLVVKEALEALGKKDYLKVATLTLNYYDKAYMRGVLKRDSDKIVYLELADSDSHFNAKYIKRKIEG